MATATWSRIAPDEAQAFVQDTLLAPTRTLPIVALTTPPGSVEPWIDPDVLGADLRGRTQVVVIETGEATWARIGRSRSDWTSTGVRAPLVAGVDARVADPAEVLRVGEQVNVLLLELHPPARRLHWWSVPGADGGRIEFARVALHDDVSIPE